MKRKLVKWFIAKVVPKHVQQIIIETRDENTVLMPCGKTHGQQNAYTRVIE